MLRLIRKHYNYAYYNFKKVFLLSLTCTCYLTLEKWTNTLKRNLAKFATDNFVTTPPPTNIEVFSQINKYRLKFIFVLICDYISEK